MVEHQQGCLEFFINLLNMLVSAVFGAAALLNPQPIPSPTLELIFSPSEAASPAELGDAQDILAARLQSLEALGLIEASSASLTESASIRVQLAPLLMETDPLLEALLSGGYLEIVDVAAVPADAIPGVGTTIRTTAQDEHQNDSSAGIVFSSVLTHEDILGARALYDELGQRWSVYVDLFAESAQRFGDFSEGHTGKRLAIVLDGEVLLVATVQARIESPILIAGDFSASEAQTLAVQLSSSPLPIALQVQSMTIIQP